MNRFLICLVLIVIPASASAAPSLINAQGKLSASNGSALADGTYSITFAIYDAASGGTVIWTEPNPAVAVTDGQFNVLLGSLSPISNSVFSGNERYLGIKVGTDPEMVPRSRLVSVGYSQRVATVDGASGGAVDGNLAVSGEVLVGGQRALTANAQDIWVGDLLGGDGIRGLVLKAGDADRLRITTAGNVGIGTNAPSATLDVYGSIGLFGNSYIMRDGNLNGIVFGTPGFSTDQNRRMFIADNGNVGIGTTAPTRKLDVIGTTSTEVLEITGGQDLAEPFAINSEEALAPGTVVIIDSDHEGKLRISDSAYDKRVAGIVSGAGGIKPGLTLKQGTDDSRNTHVALTGQVYALATASNGAIEPGDLLTTSTVAGHAMKASDRSRWDGAVIGKAMSKLERGEGLVLVLVNLQ